MKLTTNLKLAIVTWFVALFCGFAQSQDGTIQGTITDNYGIYVPGASVMITSLDKGVVSDQDGKFTFVNVPAGDYTITVKYLGFKNTEIAATVTAGQTTAVTINIASEDVQLDEVQVMGYGLNGQAKALNTQKNNTNITNVVSTDQIGKFPDANIGDAVKRIPGITMQVDQGEARNIIIRGLAPQFNSVTLNGSRIPSAEGDNRNVQMDLIPSDMIQTIEVNKAVTPDMDGDALGGSVNLITRSAPQSFRLSATVGSGINFISDKRILNGSFLVGDRAKNGKFGWMLSASINDNDFGSDNIEAEWSDEFEYSPTYDEDDIEEVAVNPYNSTFEQRTYLVQRVRRSFSANFDYKFNSNNNIFLKSMYNWRDDRENRFRVEYEILDPEDIGPNDYQIDNGNLVMFPAEAARETKGGISGGRNNNRRLEDQRMQNYTLGGNHLLGSVKLDWLASYAKASEERLNERYLAYESEFLVSRSLDSEYPRYRAVDAADDLPANYEFKELTEENQYTEEEDINVFVNAQLPLDIFGKGDGFLKFGARGRFKNKNRKNNFHEFEFVNGDFENMANVPTADYSDSDFMAGSQYLTGNFATAHYLGSLNLFDDAQFTNFSVPSEYLGENFEVTENVVAGYVMANQKLSDKLNVLFGVRIENTNLESKGNSFNPDDVDDAAEEGDDFSDAVTVQEGKSSYTNVLPSVHFKYNASENTVLRFAWTNTLSRPNYVDLVPYRSQEDDEVTLGNPDLKPATSMNFDFMAEHYFQSIGIISGGVFYKAINDFAYTYQSDGEDGNEYYQPFNGDDAKVYGAEISFQRQLDFLPGFAKNFGVYLNYTYLNSEANGIRNEDGDDRGTLDLPGSSPNMFNGSLSYSDKKFSARLSANFSDSYLDELGGNSFEDRYYDNQFFLDFNINYAINKNWSIYADLNNITNQPLRYYQGVSSRTMQLEYYNRRLTFGLKYNLY